MKQAQRFATIAKEWSKTKGQQDKLKNGEKPLSKFLFNNRNLDARRNRKVD